MPPLASAVEPEQTVSRSRTITRPTRSRARWYAVLAPMMPAPMMTTSAVSVIAASRSLRRVAVQGKGDRRVALGGEIGGQRHLHDLARLLGRDEDGPVEGHRLDEVDGLGLHGTLVDVADLLARHGGERQHHPLVHRVEHDVTVAVVDEERALGGHEL